MADIKVIAKNRQAYHLYFIEDKYEAGTSVLTNRAIFSIATH